MSEQRTEGGWDEEHYQYKCHDGYHPSFWKTIVESPQWKAWEREVGRRLSKNVVDQPVFDVDECREVGWFSSEHFAAFLDFCEG